VLFVSQTEREPLDLLVVEEMLVDGMVVWDGGVREGVCVEAMAENTRSQRLCCGGGAICNDSGPFPPLFPLTVYLQTCASWKDSANGGLIVFWYFVLFFWWFFFGCSLLPFCAKEEKKVLP
jgi:hypothetical protein